MVAVRSRFSPSLLPLAHEQHHNGDRYEHQDEQSYDAEQEAHGAVEEEPLPWSGVVLAGTSCTALRMWRAHLHSIHLLLCLHVFLALLCLSAARSALILPDGLQSNQEATLVSSRCCIGHVDVRKVKSIMTMSDDKQVLQERHDSCRVETSDTARYHLQLPEVVETVIHSCEDCVGYSHVDFEPIPSREVTVKILYMLRDLLFPGYFSREKVDPITLRYAVGRTTTTVFDLLAEQIALSVRHDCYRYGRECSDCAAFGHEAALALLEDIPRIRALMATDVRATFDGDPAAASPDEIIFGYPGIQATYVYRLAHRLFELGVPLLPRIMTEHVHGITGIDIHPGASIGEGFVVDHGTGVVVGETVSIGKNVRVYQGVTLGALSLPKGCGDRFRGGVKRHPTIEDEVIIYAGATILGGDVVIGARSVIGGNVWITESVPPDTTVLAEPPRLTYKAMADRP